MNKKLEDYYQEKEEKFRKEGKKNKYKVSGKSVFDIQKRIKEETKNE